MGNISPLLAARDMKRTIEFYQKTLGFQVGVVFPTVDNPEYVDLIKDGMVLMFIPAKNIGVSSEEKFGIGVSLYMQIDGDIDKYYEELKQKGVKLVEDIKDEPFGIRDFTIEDVDGYRLTFNQTSTAKKCLSCGMPMTKPEEFGGGNPENMFCVHCSNPDGSLKTYDEVLNGMVNFMMTSQSLDRKTAEKRAREHMANMPAWGGG
jgi:uncharacterized glyoxalase superfamily protein PhnB